MKEGLILSGSAVLKGRRVSAPAAGAEIEAAIDPGDPARALIFELHRTG